LLDRGREFPGTFSAGEKERLSIAQALVTRPRILFADEPTGNLDPELSREVMSLLCAMPASGTTVMIATHDISLLEQFPHVPILELRNGQVLHNGIEKKKSDSAIS
jgi:cell division transport system ATP-binding protein